MHVGVFFGGGLLQDKLGYGESFFFFPFDV